MKVKHIFFCFNIYRNALSLNWQCKILKYFAYIIHIKAVLIIIMILQVNFFSFCELESSKNLTKQVLFLKDTIKAYFY